MSADSPEGDDRRADEQSDLVGLAKLAATAGWHTAEWAAGTYVKGVGRLLGVVARPDTAVDVVNDVRRAARDAARDLVGYADIEERVRSATAESPTAQRFADRVRSTAESPTAQRVAGTAQRVASAVPYPAPPPPREEESSRPRPKKPDARKDGAGKDRNGHETLRERGDELLRKSRDVWYEYEDHPAYERILEELAPDEGRILRLMLTDGPQPSVDVRTGGPIGMLHSELIAPGLNMIGARAGCRYVERVPSYLNNLQRLGLIWFSRETLHDHLAYQVVEAQPDVLDAFHSVRAAKIVRRSIHLTPFGEDFCRDCLSIEVAAVESLPEHSTPTARKMGPSPPKE
jgi:hypothetical protein